MENQKRPTTYTAIPTQWIDALLIKGLADYQAGEPTENVVFPLATYETPLWASVNRGVHVFNASGGLTVNFISESMTRSIVFSVVDAKQTQKVWALIKTNIDTLKQEVKKISRHTQLEDIFPQFIGNQLYLRLSFNTGDASGHNMATIAAQSIQNWLLDHMPSLRYGSISANICVDKKNSAINSILGRGKSVIAECIIPKKILRRYLKTTASALLELHIQKNLLGSLLAGSVRSANAHYANMLLAFYLACGQDGANIVEGSQGITHLEKRGDDEEDLYFSVSIPNIIVGSIGNGKHLDASKQVLEKLGCLAPREGGGNARRLACIVAAAVASGEISLLAAQTNQGELVEAHIRLERQS